MFTHTKLVRGRIVDSQYRHGLTSLRCQNEGDSDEINRHNLDIEVTNAGFLAGEQVVIIPARVLAKLCAKFGQDVVVSTWDL